MRIEHIGRAAVGDEEVTELDRLAAATVGALAAALVVSVLVLWPPPIEPFAREGSAQRPFFGLGMEASTVLMALLYGILQTGFSEELLFRGLIAGSLFRRLSERLANVVQALVFLLPHLIILTVMPEMWWILPVIFLGALFAGWLRARSGSIVGPWLLHATVNVTMAVSIAVRSVA